MKRLLLLLAATLLATPIWAQNDTQSQEGSGAPPPEAGRHVRNMHPPSPEQQVKRLTKELNLAAEQQTQVKQIFADQEKNHDQDRESMQNLSPGERRDRFEQTRREVDAKIEAVLTDAQQQKFNAMRSHMKQHRMHGEGNGQQPAPPPDSQQ